MTSSVAVFEAVIVVNQCIW